MSQLESGNRLLHGANRFLQTRARLRRPGGAKTLNGWIEALDQTHVRVRLKSHSATVDVGEVLAAELIGGDKRATFPAIVSRHVGAVLELERTGPIELVPGNESAHVSLFGERCQVVCNGKSYDATTLDIADHGLGIVLTAPIPVSADVEFRLMCSAGTIQGRGWVLYCHEELADPGRFRAGFSVVSMGIVDRARWKLLLDRGFAPH